LGNVSLPAESISTARPASRIDSRAVLGFRRSLDCDGHAQRGSNSKRGGRRRNGQCRRYRHRNGELLDLHNRDGDIDHSKRWVLRGGVRSTSRTRHAFTQCDMGRSQLFSRDN
jgi:hypothetical protein